MRLPPSDNSTTRRFSCVLLGLAVVLGFAFDVHASDFPGVKLPGQLLVNDRGYSNYTIPLDIAVGSGGLTPSLGLNYGGIGTIAYLGQGWSLSGFSTIYRGQQTVDVDGVSANPTGSSTDALYLDGSRLIVLGVSGDGVATLKSIRADYSRIRAFNWTKPDQYFEVKTKAGLTLRLGASPNSRATLNSVAYSWNADQVSDTAGNYFKTSYLDVGPTEKLPLYIDYTGNTRTGTQPYVRLSFEYSPSPKTYVGYHFGVAQSRSKLLSAIVETIRGVEHHRYSLNYKPTKYWPGAELESLDSVYPTGTVKGPKFSYMETTSAWQTISGYAPPVSLGSAIDQSYAIELADVDGRGIEDFFDSYSLQGKDTSTAFSGSQNGWRENKAFALPVPLQIDSQPVKGRMFVDLDGDGKLDLIVADSGNRHTFLRRGKDWFEDSRYALPFDLAANGHKVTAIRIVPSNGKRPIEILWSDGKKSGALVGSKTGLQPSQELTPPLPFSFTGSATRTSVLADLDCSGHPELVYFGEDAVVPSGVPIVYQFSAHHWSKTAAPELQLPSSVRGQVAGYALVRLENSGCQNLLVRMKSGSSLALSHSNGTSITTIPAGVPSLELPSETDESTISFADYDADGNAALGGVNTGGKLLCARWISGTWNSCPNVPDPGIAPGSISRVIVGDFDGNKRLDVLVIADAAQPDKARGLVFLGTPSGYQVGDGFFPQSVKLASVVDFFSTRFVDLNGDGLADILVLGDSKASRKATAYLNTGTGWIEEPRYALSIDFGESSFLAESLQLLDFNGDGAPDALVCDAGWNNAQNCHVLANVCPRGPSSTVTTCFVDSGLPKFPTELYSVDHGDLGVRLVDLNADGRLDVLLGRQKSDGSSIRHAWIWDGQNWAPSDKFAPLVDFVSERAEWGATAGRNADLGVRIGDLNGDRLPDLAINDPLPSNTPPGSAIPCDKTRCTSAFLLTAQGWQRSTAYDAPVGPQSAQEATEFWSTYVDVNGDGLDDLLTFSYTGRISHAYINTGTGLVEDPAYAIPQEMFGDDNRDLAVHILDVNADGQPDLIRASRKQDGSVLRRAYLNSGSGWVPTSQEYAPDRAISDFATGDLGTKLIDVDGNGNPDFLFGLVSAVGTTAERITIGNLNQRAGLLSEVDEGLGSTTKVNYSSAIGGSRQTARAPEQTDDVSSYPLIPLNAPTWLVANTSVAVIGRGTVTRQFSFGPFIIDVGRGIPVGPAWRRVTDDDAGSSIETHFEHSTHLEGLVASEATFDVSGLRSTTRNKYSIGADNDCPSTNQSNPCFDSLPVETLSTDFDSAANPTYSSQQRFEYDKFGDVTRLVVEYLSVKGATVERSTETENTFDNDLDAWYLGRLTQSKVTHRSKDSSPVVSESQFKYDPLTGLLSSEHANSQTQKSFRRVFERDLFGNVLTSKLRAGPAIRTEYEREYDAEGRFVSKTCNALRHCETYRRRFFDGRATFVRDPNGQETHFDYDDLGRVLKVISDTSTLTSEYRAVTGTESVRASFERVTRLNGGDATIARFDGGGALIRLSKPGFNGQRVIETARYSGEGLLQEKTEAAYSGHSQRRWRYTYDAFGQLSSVKAPNGFTTVYQSHDQSISKSTTAGPVATQEFSSDRKVTKLIDALHRTVFFHYDAAGRQDRITLANGVEYSIRYDNAGHKSEVRDPDRGTTRYDWNEFGDLKQLQMPNGASISMDYDAIGRLIRRRTPDEITEWQYDHGSNAVGQLSEVHNDRGYAEERQYGPMGRVSQIQYVIDGEKFLENFGYSPTGALLAYRAPNSVATTYKYDKNGFVETVDLSEPRQRIWTAVSYSPNGQVTEARLGDHIRSVSELSETTGVIKRLLMEADGQSIDDVRYETNDAGYVVARKDTRAARVDEFSYDPLGQLVGWKQNGQPRETYDYDNLGNTTRQSQNGNIDYPDQGTFPHRAAMAHVGAKGIPIRYDDSGRTISFGETAIEYTSDGLPRKISNPRLGQTEMRNGPNGQVFVERTSHGLAEIDVVHAGRFERIHVCGMRPYFPSGEEYTYRNLLVTPSGVIGYVESTNWVFGRGLPTIEGELFGAEAARAIGSTSQIRFVQTDLLGSPRLIVDGQGKLLERFYTNPWGAGQFAKNHKSNGREKRIDNPFSFGGYAATGTDDVVRSGPRLYSSLLGRFLEPDPVLPGASSDLGTDLNPYMFARNSPLRYADPSGFGIFDSIGDFFDHVGGAVVGFITGGPAGAIIGGIVGLHRAGELIDQYWRPALIIAAGVALTVASGGTLGPVVAAMLGGALAGGLSAALYGGSITDVLQGAVRGAIVGLIGGAAGEVASSMQAGILGQITLGGVAGGFTNVVEGGSFEQGLAIGALSAGLAALARNYYLDRTMASRMITRAVIGGTVATVEGGKFENGAAMAAFSVAAEGAADTIASETSNIRGLTGGEIAMAAEMLTESGLDPSIVKWEDVRVINGQFFELDSSNAITPYGAIFMPSKNYSDDYFSDTEIDPGQFKHEIVHVYQYYRGDFVTARGFWEQGKNWLRLGDPYNTPGTQEYEASCVSGYGSHSCK